MTPGHVARSVAELVRGARDARASLHQRHDAFTLLVERFEAMALGVALLGSESLEAARDACQEAFLAAWRTLPDLREPAAFGGWLKRLVRTHCARARRRRSASAEAAEWPCREAGLAADSGDAAELLSRRETEKLIRDAVRDLPAGERDAVTLFYFLGESLRVVARVQKITVARAGKRLYNARLHLRHRLPRSVAEAFLVTDPTPAFVRRVQAGVFDDFMGEYRFASRPDRVVSLRREGALLVSYASGQRNILASLGEDSLAPTEYDGEARFGRSRSGRVSHFIYYEFGRRLGIARKVPRPLTGGSGDRGDVLGGGSGPREDHP